MSSFFSKKYLQYVKGASSAAQPRLIEDDVTCPSCKYNLKGLMTGQRCPECGTAMDPVQAASDGSVRRSLHDVLGEGDASSRARWQQLLTMAAWCVMAAILARIVYSVGGDVVDRAVAERVYVLFLVGLSVAWATVASKIATPKIDGFWPHLALPRKLAVSTQPLWIVGTVCWSISTWAANDLVNMIGLVFRVVASIGFIALLAVFRQMADDAHLHSSERRLNAALFFLPIVSVVGSILIHGHPLALSELTRDPDSLVILFLYFGPHLIGLGLWVWVLILLVLALWRMREHARWTSFNVHQQATRPERVKAKRAVLEAEVEASIRPMPNRQSDEIPFDD